MKIVTDTLAYLQGHGAAAASTRDMGGLTPVRDARPSLKASEQGSPVTLSGEALMLSRLFGNTDADPEVVTTLTLSTMGLPEVSFLREEDRELLADMYSFAQEQGADLRYVDALAQDLGHYRMFGPHNANVNDGTMYDVEGRLQTYRFTDEDAATVARIRDGGGMSSSPLDPGFLEYLFDPGYSFNHRVDFDFMEEVINKFGGEPDAVGLPLDSKFSRYVPNGKQNFIVETAAEVTLRGSEPDWRNVNGQFVITKTGYEKGFRMLDGQPLKLDSLVDSLGLLGPARQDGIRWLVDFLRDRSSASSESAHFAAWQQRIGQAYR